MKWSEVGLVLEALDLDGVSIQLQRRRTGEWRVDVETPGGLWVSLEGELRATLEDAARAARGEPEIVWAAEIADLSQRLYTAVRALRRLRDEPSQADALDAGLDALLAASGIEGVL